MEIRASGDFQNWMNFRSGDESLNACPRFIPMPSAPLTARRVQQIASYEFVYIIQTEWF